MTTLDIYVQPNAGTNKVAGWRYKRLRVLVTASAANNEANEKAIEVVSEDLDITKSYISLKRGATSREKTLEISNYDRAQLDRCIKAAGFSEEEE